MATPITMPKLGMTMQEGRVVAWPIPLGGRVERGAPVVVIESEKAEIEIEATASGWLRHVYVELDTTVPCGTLLGAISEDGPDAPFDVAAFHREHDHPEVGPAQSARVPERTTPPSPSRAAPPGRGRPVTPAARARARALGIDPSLVPGTGPEGRVTREDVDAFAERAARLVEASEGVRLEVLRDGAGPLTALLPGFGTDVSAFAPQMRALASDHALAAVNPRGVGGSDAPETEAYDVTTMAADVAAVLPEPANVVGASLGAAVALELALGWPERVRSLVLVTPFVEATARLCAVTDAWARIAGESAPETMVRAVLPWLFSERLLADEVARERVVRGLVQAAAGVRASTLVRLAAGLRRWSGTRCGALGSITVPTLVICAGADLLTPDGAALADAIPGARALTVPDVGHAVGIEAAEVVNAAIGDHLRNDGRD